MQKGNTNQEFNLHSFMDNLVDNDEEARIAGFQDCLEETIKYMQEMDEISQDTTLVDDLTQCLNEKLLEIEISRLLNAFTSQIDNNINDESSRLSPKKQDQVRDISSITDFDLYSKDYQNQSSDLSSKCRSLNNDYKDYDSKQLRQK